ncbi:hypothetical protein E9U_02106 [Moraxella catarrhalis BC8]|nr:hypothetical protein E9U_02106 [Moraxella catarrhalis BC8]
MAIGAFILGQSFLSDLCGREDINTVRQLGVDFLSDLCGREESYTQLMITYIF